MRIAKRGKRSRSMVFLPPLIRCPRLGSHEHMHPTWKEAFRLYRQALWDPPTDVDKKRLAKLSKRTFQSADTEALRKKFNEELFSYDAFLRNLGRMSLSPFVPCVYGSICLSPFRSRGPWGPLCPAFPPKPFMHPERFGSSPPPEFEPL